MSNYIHLNEREFCFVGKSTILRGEILFAGITHIYGQIEGDVIMISQSELIIEKSGHIKGNIQCHNLSVKGRVEGIIKSTGDVVIQSGAQIMGEINAQNLIIKPGAILDTDAHTLS